MERVNKHSYYLNLAETVLERGTCLRRKFGAVIVKNDEVVSTGYVGAPRGRANCCDLGYCLREKENVPRGTRYELCRSVHAEANAIISASRSEMIDSDLYLACHDAKTGELDANVEPCSMCKRLIINAGIKRVYIKISDNSYRVIETQSWVVDDDSMALKDGY